MIILSKIVAILLAIIVITKTVHDYKKHQEILSTVIFWSFAWIGIVYISLKPSIIYGLLTDHGQSGIGTVFGIAFIFLFYVTYRVYIKANRLEQKIKNIVMEIGIKDIE